MDDSSGYPKTSQLWSGAILATIAHAIWLVRAPDFANEQSWDNMNYSVQDSQGIRGTVTFSGNSVVGAFRDDNSTRSPFRSHQEYNIGRFFKGIPPKLLKLANEETLQYLLEEYKGTTTPVITTAFWSNGEFLIGAEPWQEILVHGARLLRIQLMNINDAILEWKATYQLSDAKVALMRSLFTRKVDKPGVQIVLSSSEVRALTSDSADGINESRELLKGIGIIWP